MISLKVLHINTFDIGGAATACRRIHLGLLEKGIDSKILLLSKTKNIPQTYKFQPIKSETKNTVPPTLFQRVINKIVRTIFKPKPKMNANENRILDFRIIDKKAEHFTFPYSSYDITQSPLYQEADIIQINWASGFLNEETFFAKNTKPVIWRMPDMYACDGGYHYEKGFPFESFKVEIEKNVEIRKNNLEGKNIVFVPISQWLQQKANESRIIKNFPKKLIHNGVDFKVFKPHDKLFSRQVFNLPKDKTILLFGSDTLINKRKGFDILLDALKHIDLKNIQLVTFGVDPNISDIDYVSVGEIKDELLLSILYSASDFFIMPSIEEAFGQVTIEALASGTPVISFPNGGSLDIIKDGVNGLLAKGFSAQDLKEAISLALNMNFDQDKILADVRHRFNINDKIDEYIELYKSVLKNTSSN